MKDSAGKVLAFLEKNRGKFVSGEEMASELGISRNGIWKAIQNLRKQGYQIEAVTRRGYCLPLDSDIISEQGIRSYMNDSTLIPELYVFNEIDSTNKKVMELAFGGSASKTCVAAAMQTAGKAHHEQGFHSPEGGMYLSILLRKEDFIFKNPRMLIPLTALAVKDALWDICHISADLVGINDIYDGERKIGGILTESIGDLETGNVSCVIIGIGVNVPISKRNALTAEIAETILSPGRDRESYLQEYFSCIKNKKEYITKEWFTE